ncbi:hemerythrin domain-containing protein [Sphingomonas sp.]|uniref:hemerythrin domain-containing protein n=1 Tax=Sphingomonas sp. TaxID=28214 RepID=UPI00286CAFFE|nr:hemerythrin domain-containing protein [Sphingomonas sp.]
MAATDIFERLIQDHNKHRAMIEAIEQTKGDTPERRSLYEAFKIEATAHASSEEVTLYATLMAEVEMREYAQHAAKDHHEITDAFKATDEVDFSSTGWLASFRAVKDTYLDHIKEEEETIFPDALKDLGKAKAVELKDAYNAIKPEEIERAESGADDKIAEKIG